MHTQHICRPTGDSGNGVHVKGRGIGREDRAIPSDAVEFPEHRLLDLHLLEDRLDHEIGVGRGLLFICSIE